MAVVDDRVRILASLDVLLRLKRFQIENCDGARASVRAETKILVGYYGYTMCAISRHAACLLAGRYVDHCDLHAVSDEETIGTGIVGDVVPATFATNFERRCLLIRCGGRLGECKCAKQQCRRDDS